MPLFINTWTWLHSLVKIVFGGGVEEHPLHDGHSFGSWNVTNLSPTYSLHSSRSYEVDLEDSPTPTTMEASFLPLGRISKSFLLLVLSFYKHNISHMAKHFRRCCVQRLICSPSSIIGKCLHKLLPLNACFITWQKRETKVHTTHYALKCMNTADMIQSPNLQVSKHQLIWQTCSNALPTWSTPKTS